MGLSCFKQLPLNFGYAPLYVDTSAGARLLSGDLIASFNPLDFDFVINFVFHHQHHQVLPPE